MKKIRLLLIGILVTLAVSFAQDSKFPYTGAIKYPNGYMPTTLTEETFQSWYQKYKSGKLLASCGDGIRTTCIGEDGENVTKVESMGWATIIAAYMNDKETYDKLIKYYNSKKQSHGMMAWKANCGGIQDGGSASDGDLDVAFASVVAAWQWGGQYVDDAKNIIKIVKKLITNCNGTSVIVGGYGGNSPYGGCTETDISYYTPAFFREIAKFSGDDAWNKLADDTYKVLESNANATTGLVPDWHRYNGGAPTGGRNHTYRYDACRVPWRIAIDYLWNGNEKAKAWCTKISNWANKIGPANIKDGYNLDGSPTGQYHNLSFVGGFAGASMCNSQEIADAFGKEMTKLGFDGGFWYHGFLGTIYALTLTGHMWNPSLLIPSSTIQKNPELPAFMTVTNTANRRLNISGIRNAKSVYLTTLNGLQVKQTNLITEGKTTLDISSVKKGCYIISVRGSKGKLQKGQIVFVN